MTDQITVSDIAEQLVGALDNHDPAELRYAIEWLEDELNLLPSSDYVTETGETHPYEDALQRFLSISIA